MVLLPQNELQFVERQIVVSDFSGNNNKKKIHPAGMYFYRGNGGDGYEMKLLIGNMSISQ
jgi:hypothetical protein